jgi:hypothetical protein
MSESSNILKKTNLQGKDVNMSPLCSACVHESIKAINKQLVQGESVRNVAEHFGLKPSSIQRHKKDHLPVTIVQSKKAKELIAADGLVVEISSLKARAYKLLDAIEKEVFVEDGTLRQDEKIIDDVTKKYLPILSGGKIDTLLRTIREIRGLIELIGRLQGQMDNQVTVITNSPAFIIMMGDIINFLEPVPEQKKKLIDYLKKKAIETTVTEM